MKLKSAILAIVCLLLTHLGMSQSGNPYVITGKVIDHNSDQPLELATVALLPPNDSSIIKGETTNEDGTFSIEAEQGKYRLRIQFVSYQAKILQDIRLHEGNKKEDVGEIRLKESAENLSEVVVEGRRSQMTMEKGKKVFNVGSNLSNSGASASDVLDNIPALEVNMDGAITLRGQGVRILVNGRPSGMVGISGSEALRFFPANQIKEVEVITNPSARYEAQGSGGIINIILKEQHLWGLNGTFSLEAGYPREVGGSANLNYRNKWYNLFGNYTFNADRQLGGGWREQQFYPGTDSTNSTRTEEDEIDQGQGHYMQFGSNFYLSRNDILRVSVDYDISTQDEITDLVYKDYNASGELTQYTRRDRIQSENENDFDINLNYDKDFRKDGHELKADFQVSNNSEIEDSELEEEVGDDEEDLEPSLLQRSLNDRVIDTYFGKIDYVLPLTESSELEAGVRGENRIVNNDYNLEQRPDETQDWNSREDFTNHFLYDEAIIGVYTTYSDAIGDKITYKGGLRYEYTAFSTELKQTDHYNYREYSNLFPSLSMTYELGNNNNIQASYSKRLNRPRFWEMNPFNSLVNDRNYETGNPDLDPEFTDAYDLGYVNSFEKGSFYASAFYRLTTGEIEDIKRIIDDGVTLEEPRNLATQEDFGLDTRYTMNLYEWWVMTLSADFYRSEIKGKAGESDLDSETYTMDGEINNQFNIEGWFRLEMEFEYDAPEQGPQEYEQAEYEFDMGLRKQMFNNRGNLSVSVRDLLNTDNNNISNEQGENWTAQSLSRWSRGPRINVNLSYKLEALDDKVDKTNSNIFGGGE